MENTIIAALTRDVNKTYKELQYGYGFRRVLDEELESVTFLPGSIFRLWINQENHSYPLHWHTAAEMIIPLENEYYVTMDSIRYALQPGDIFIVPSCELHRIDAPAEGKRLILLFDCSQFESIPNYAVIKNYLNKPILINGVTAPSIYQEQCEIVSQICKDYFQGGALRDTSIHAGLIQFFVNYARFASSGEVRNYIGSSRNKQLELQHCFNTVYDYIDKHITDDLTLERVAEVACFSKFHFSRLFKEYSGYSFYDYIRMQKIKHATELLRNPHIPIIEIALQTGFANLTTFNRTFKAIKGCTPTAYRKLLDTDAT